MQISSFHKYLSHLTTIFLTVKSLKNANAALMGGRVQIMEIPQQPLGVGKFGLLHQSVHQNQSKKFQTCNLEMTTMVLMILIFLSDCENKNSSVLILGSF